MSDKTGYYGEFGGAFVPEDLQEVLRMLNQAFNECKEDPNFIRELDYHSKEFIGRPSPLYYARKLSESLGGASIYLKREDLNHTGSHKINNVVGQALLAKKMGLKRIIAETGAGQHGVATATAAALFDMDCIIYMGEEDTRRQSLNVFRMQLLGAEVVPVSSGNKRLKDAVDEALKDLVANFKDTYYLLGSAVGPHPYPEIVRYFQSVIGREVKEQIVEKHGKLPDCIMACVGGGSNAIGLFHPFIEERDVRIIGVEPGGKGIETGMHAAPLSSSGRVEVIHGFKCHVVADENGNILPTHSIAAGLDYPGVGPEHSFLKDSGRAQYFSITDDEALEGFQKLSCIEGITPALESAHAVAYAMKLAPTMEKDQAIVINLSGRGDKDVEHVYNLLQDRNI